jgi:hypothetical protein
MVLTSWYSLNSTIYEYWTAERNMFEAEMLEADIKAARETTAPTRPTQMPPNESALNLAKDYLCQIHSIEQNAKTYQEVVRKLDKLRWLLYRGREQLILAQPTDQALDSKRQELLAEVNEDEFYTTSERIAINQLLQAADRRRSRSAEPDPAERGVQAENRAQALANAYRIRDDIQAINFFKTQDHSPLPANFTDCRRPSACRDGLLRRRLLGLIQ